MNQSEIAENIVETLRHILDANLLRLRLPSLDIVILLSAVDAVRSLELNRLPVQNERLIAARTQSLLTDGQFNLDKV